MVLQLVIIAALVFLVSVVATRASIAWARQQNIVDHPNHRSSHTRPTPRGGGIGILAAIVVGIAVATAFGFVPYRLASSLLCGIPIAVVGYIDDRISLSARLRLFVQAACVALALWILSPLPALEIADFVFQPVAAALFYLVAIVWLINLFNFMDGIDGIAAGQAIAIGLLWVLVLQSPISVLGAVFAAAASGFLVFNWPPAKIFMGDVGSGFCGYYIGICGLALPQQQPNTSFFLGLIPAAPFILDATLTLIIRLLKGHRPGVAHRSHAYQRASRQLGRHGPVSLAFFLMAFVWFGAAFAWADTHALSGFSVFVLAALPVVVGLLILGAGSDE